MKLPTIVILSLACALATAATVFASPTPSVFQIRLVEDKPSADSEPMSSITQSKYGANTNVLNVQKTILMDQSTLQSAKEVTDDFGQSEILITFTKSGADRFAAVTRQNIKKRLAIIVNGKIWEAPVIMDEISDGSAQIAGRFSKQEAEAVAKQINDTIHGE